MKYHNITKDDMLNGDGLRVVLWVSGCEHRCAGCHNQITWDEKCGLEFDDTAKREIFCELEHSYISGITFSGGDPLHINNRCKVGELIVEIKNKYPEKTVWLYTGYLWEDICDLDFIKQIDVLVDGRFVRNMMDNKLHWRGSANQRVIDVKKTFEKGKVVLYE